MTWKISRRVAVIADVLAWSINIVLVLSETVLVLSETVLVLSETVLVLVIESKRS